MKISENSVVTFDYVLKNDKGEVLDSNEGLDPVSYLYGKGPLVPGLEKALMGKAEGESFEVSVTPEEGYGARDEDWTFEVPRNQLPDGIEPEVGMNLTAHGPSGEALPVWVNAIQGDNVLLDANHPLAGETLHFKVDVRKVREASASELTHSHVCSGHCE